MKQHVSSQTNLLILVFTLSLVSIAAQARDSLDALRTDLNALASDPVFETGEITGKALFCNDQNLSQDILVQIPGLLFQANTDATGRFTLSYVPTGTYSLTFSKNGSVLNTEVGVAVAKRVSTDIGTKVFCPDLDNDGYLPPNDCDNANPVVYPGAPELCGDGSDNNCNGQTDESCPTCSDADNDTFYAQVGCGIVDCNDGNNTISPAAAEICDGVDNNCNGQIDEAGALNAHAYYPDNDQDGFGDNSQEQITCTPPAGFISVGGDCNDSVASVNPAAEEFCGNGLDDDCDGVVDEVDTHGGCSTAVCSDQELAALQANCIDGSSLTSGCIASSNLSATCNQGVLGLAQCAISNTPDCFDPSLSFDEAMACVYYASSSPCQLEIENVLGNYVPGECVPGATQTCGSYVGQCTQGQQTCSDYATWGSCNGGVLPSDEICDQIDNDCNGVVDNNCVACVDADGDGFYSTLECPLSNGVVDCDDSQAGVNPGAIEACDDIDNNCDGAIDETCPANLDSDMDGYSPAKGDCNDANASVYPQAPEYCNGIDTNCNGLVNEDVAVDAVLYYPDNDGDGYGQEDRFGTAVYSCSQPSGFVRDNTDCYDSDPNTFPGAPEICGDGLDQNCNGEIDESCP